MLRPAAFVAAALLAATGCAAYQFHAGPLPGEPAKAQFVDVEGAHIRYVDVGGGQRWS